MTSLSFRYKDEGYGPRPKIPITLIHDDKRLKVMALVDSGSDLIIIPKFIAETLELSLKGKEEPIKGVGGELKTVNSHVTIKINNTVLRNLTVKIPLTGEWDEILLGRRPFFEYFDITFEENEKRVRLIKTKHI